MSSAFSHLLFTPFPSSRIKLPLASRPLHFLFVQHCYLLSCLPGRNPSSLVCTSSRLFKPRGLSFNSLLWVNSPPCPDQSLTWIWDVSFYEPQADNLIVLFSIIVSGCCVGLQFSCPNTKLTTFILVFFYISSKWKRTSKTKRDEMHNKDTVRSHVL